MVQLSEGLDICQGSALTAVLACKSRCMLSSGGRLRCPVHCWRQSVRPRFDLMSRILGVRPHSCLRPFIMQLHRQDVSPCICGQYQQLQGAVQLLEPVEPVEPSGWNAIREASSQPQVRQRMYTCMLDACPRLLRGLL